LIAGVELQGRVEVLAGFVGLVVAGLSHAKEDVVLGAGLALHGLAELALRAVEVAHALEVQALEDVALVAVGRDGDGAGEAEAEAGGVSQGEGGLAQADPRFGVVLAPVGLGEFDQNVTTKRIENLLVRRLRLLSASAQLLLRY
jgi:predicted transcriptional regulator